MKPTYFDPVVRSMAFALIFAAFGGNSAECRAESVRAGLGVSASIVPHCAISAAESGSVTETCTDGAAGVVGLSPAVKTAEANSLTPPIQAAGTQLDSRKPFGEAGVATVLY